MSSIASDVPAFAPARADGASDDPFRFAPSAFLTWLRPQLTIIRWINNYGVWVDEFQAMGLEDCLHVVWPKAKVWLDDKELGEE